MKFLGSNISVANRAIWMSGAGSGPPLYASDDFTEGQNLDRWTETDAVWTYSGGKANSTGTSLQRLFSKVVLNDTLFPLGSYVRAAWATSVWSVSVGDNYAGAVTLDFANGNQVNCHVMKNSGGYSYRVLMGGSTVVYESGISTTTSGITEIERTGAGTYVCKLDGVTQYTFTEGASSEPVATQILCHGVGALITCAWDYVYIRNPSGEIEIA